MRISRLSTLLFTLATVGCVGPLVVDETARTVGHRNSEVVLGAGQAGGVLKYTYGLADSLDFGLQLEAQATGLRLKYAVLNQREVGFSAALAGGVGYSAGGSHVYGDLMASYLFGTFEPYATFRYVRVTTDPQEFKDHETHQTYFTLPSAEFQYGQAILGTRLWFNPHWLASVEAAQLWSINGVVRLHSGVIINGAVGYRF